MASASSQRRWLEPRIQVLVLAGLLASFVMAARAQIGGDQVTLLRGGWTLANDGRLIPHGNPLSNGGYAPGVLTNVLVGLPLVLWRHHTAPALLVVAFHLAAYLLLDRILGQILSPRGRLVFCLLYWLNPWRLYFSAFLWNPNYLCLFGAVHLWTSWRQRREPSFLLSFLHALAIGLAAQLHPQALILVLASAVLLFRRGMRLHAGGLLMGAVAVAASLLPWVFEIARHPELLPGGPSRLLVMEFNHRLPLSVLRGLGYWLKYSSWVFPERLTRFDFTPDLGRAADAVLSPLAFWIVRWGGQLTIAAPLAANLWLLSKSRRDLRRMPTRVSDRRWLRGYVVSTLAGVLLAFVLSPTTVMLWQAFIVLPVAVLPLVLWAEVALRRVPRSARLTFGRIHAVGTVVVLLALIYGSPQYRCGGRFAVAAAVASDDGMVQALKIDACAASEEGGRAELRSDR